MRMKHYSERERDRDKVDRNRWMTDGKRVKTTSDNFLAVFFNVTVFARLHGPLSSCFFEWQKNRKFDQNFRRPRKILKTFVDRQPADNDWCRQISWKVIQCDLATFESCWQYFSYKSSQNILLFWGLFRETSL